MELLDRLMLFDQEASPNSTQLSQLWVFRKLLFTKLNQTSSRNLCSDRLNVSSRVSSTTWSVRPWSIRFVSTLSHSLFYSLASKYLQSLSKVSPTHPQSLYWSQQFSDPSIILHLYKIPSKCPLHSQWTARNRKNSNNSIYCEMSVGDGLLHTHPPHSTLKHGCRYDCAQADGSIRYSHNARKKRSTAEVYWTRLYWER